MKETQQSIAEWADEAFGTAPSIPRIAARANEEMAELLRRATSHLDGDVETVRDADEWRHQLAEEAADVVIVLYRLVAVIGLDLQSAIDRKMAVNRKRTWTRDGTGHGYHVRAKVQP